MIKVSVEVLAGIDAARVGLQAGRQARGYRGTIDMFDRQIVIRWCYWNNYHEAGYWIEGNAKSYAHGLIDGFQLENESETR